MRARATKDIDLSISETEQLSSNPYGSAAALLDLLQAEAARDLDDHFSITIGRPQQTFDAPPEGGARFPVEVRLAGRRFTVFHLDVGMGDPIIEEPEWQSGEELLAFAGIPAARILLIPVAQQIAAKLHIYTLPRAAGSNSRVKDLVDLTLLLEQEAPEPIRVRAAVVATFGRRATHAPPLDLPAPPESWAGPYAELAATVAARCTTAEDAHRLVAGFWRSLNLSP